MDLRVELLEYMSKYIKDNNPEGQNIRADYYVGLIEMKNIVLDYLKDKEIHIQESK
jgi:hypothetical protein